MRLRLIAATMTLVLGVAACSSTRQTASTLPALPGTAAPLPTDPPPTTVRPTAAPTTNPLGPIPSIILPPPLTFPPEPTATTVRPTTARPRPRTTTTIEQPTPEPRPPTTAKPREAVNVAPPTTRPRPRPSTTLAPPTTARPRPATTLERPTPEPPPNQPPPESRPLPWTPACTARPARPASKLNEQALNTFTRLAAGPSLTITLPQYTGLPQPADPGVSVARVAGGVLLAVRPPDGAPLESTVLSVINANGTVRWTKCLTETIIDVAAWPTAAQAAVTVATAIPGAVGVRLLSLANGTFTQDLTKSVTAVTGVPPRPVAVTPGALFFGRVDEAPVAATAKLARLDLATGKVQSRPYPPSTVGKQYGLAQFATTASGSLYLVGAPPIPARAVLTGGKWSSTTADIAKVYGAQVGFTTARTLVRWAPNGKVLWERKDLTDRGAEGFSVGVSGAVVVANICVGTAENACDPRIVGLDVRTGKTLWNAAGVRQVAVLAANGLALLTDPTGNGWTMINVSNGKALDATQKWKGADTFSTGCCGEDEFLHTTRNGAVVMAVNRRVVRVWYARGAAPKAVKVDRL